MKKMILLFLLFVVVYPVDANRRWRMKFTYEKPEYLRVRDSSGEVQTYWYMLYAVTNPTEEEHHISLELKVITDDNHVYYNSLFPAIEKLVEAKKKQKFLNVLEMKGEEFDGKIGPNETKLGIALFGRIDDEMDEMNVHISGLVDVISYEENSVWKDLKVKVITYSRKGDEFNRHLDLVEYVGSTWITPIRKKIRDLTQKSQ
jgi:hypothetical protein